VSSAASAVAPEELGSTAHCTESSVGCSVSTASGTCFAPCQVRSRVSDIMVSGRYARLFVVVPARRRRAGRTLRPPRRAPPLPHCRPLPFSPAEYDTRLREWQHRKGVIQMSSEKLQVSVTTSHFGSTVELAAL
jgi:hypothetical protein